VDKKSKILVYPVGSTQAVRYDGIAKLDSLTKFFESVIDGTADLTVVNEQAAAEEFVPDEAELEIERKQEAQRMALAHGGFAEFIDFEDALKKGHGADFHSTHGYPGAMDDLPKKKVTEEAEVAGDAKESVGAEKEEPAVEAEKVGDQATFAGSPVEEPEPSAPAEPTSSEAVEEKIESVPEPEPAAPIKDEL